MRRLLFSILVLLCSCSSEVEPVVPDSCSVVVQSTWPDNGSTTAHYRQHVEFHLSAPVDQATVGSDIAGFQWVSDDGLTIGFTPDTELEPSTEYRFTLSYCGGEPEISFTTSNHGVSISDEQSLIGATYYVDLRTIKFFSGGNVSDILLSIFARNVLLQITDASAEALSFRFAVAKESAAVAAQDTCYRTLEQSNVMFDTNPLFTFNTELLEFDAFSAMLRLRSMSLEGSVAPDVLSLAGISFNVVLDVREVTEMMGVDNYEEVCALAGNVGTECEPCVHDDVVACIQVEGTGLTGTLVGGDLIEIGEMNTHEECEKTEQD